MNTILSFVLLCAFMPTGVQGAAQPGQREQAARADLIVVAEVVEVGQSPGFWGGGYLLPRQSVTYREVEVLKGSLTHSPFEVGFYITAINPLMDRDQPRLSPEIFARGKRHILFLKSAQGETATNNVPTLNERGEVVFKEPSEFNGTAASRKVPVSTDGRSISLEEAAERKTVHVFEPTQLITLMTSDANTVEALKKMIPEK